MITTPHRLVEYPITSHLLPCLVLSFRHLAVQRQLLDPYLLQLGVLLLELLLVVLVLPLDLLPHLGVVVQVLLLELLLLLLILGHLLGVDLHPQLVLDLNQEGVAPVDLLPHRLPQLLAVEVLLVVGLVQLVDTGAELALVGLQGLLEVLGHLQLLPLLRPVVPLVALYLLYLPLSKHVRHAVFGVVDLAHHQLSVVLAHLGVQLLGRSHQDVLVERTCPFDAPVCLLGHPHVQFLVQYLGVHPPLDLVHPLEPLRLLLAEAALDGVSHPLPVVETHLRQAAVVVDSLEDVGLDQLGGGQLLVGHVVEDLGGQGTSGEGEGHSGQSQHSQHQLIITIMPVIRTNLLRVEIGSSHLVYQAELRCNVPLQEDHLPQIESLIYEALPMTVYEPPFLYSAQPLTTTTFQFFLTFANTAEPLTLFLLSHAQQQNSKSILKHIANRLLRLAQLLYCAPLRMAFNPYEQQTVEGRRLIPGVRVDGAEGALWVEAGMMEIGGEIGEGKVLIDEHSGKFYLKQSIVRVDKGRGQVFFRSGVSVSSASLHSFDIRPLSGFPLADMLSRTIARIKEVSADFCSHWNISFDSRLLQAPYNIIQPGHLTFRDGQERSLTQLATPITHHSYIHNFTNLFNGVSLCDVIQAEVVWLCSQKERVWTVEMAKAIDGLKFRMGLGISCKMQGYSSLEHSQQILKVLKRESGSGTTNKIIILPHCKLINKQQKEGWENVVQCLIETGLKFHPVEVDPSNRDFNFEAAAYRHLSIIYTKFGLNPWQIKGVPFMNNPMTAMSIHVQATRKGLSVAVVATMNIYMTKFTANRRLCAKDGVHRAVQEGIKECIDKFREVHGRYPNRVMAFRMGLGEEGDLREEAHQVKQAFLRHTGSVVTYIMPTCQHSLRTYNEIDRNYLSKDTAKKVQLLLYINIQGQLYCQLQLEQPMHRIRVYEVQPNDPNFMAKALELTAKLVLGGVGNTYGHGLGFLDYGKRLNAYRDYDWERCRVMLRDGVLSFL